MLINKKDLKALPKHLDAYPADWMDDLDEDIANFYNYGQKYVELGETTWPAEEKDIIAEIFRRIGVEDPLRQKLVEPFALFFGGKKEDGRADLSGVNWVAVREYFRWEAAVTVGNQTLAERLQQEKFKRDGVWYSHYPVYDPEPYGGV